MYVGNFLFWINNIYMHYQNCVVKNNCMLVFDKATTHIKEEIIKFLNDNNINYVIIPPGFTRFLQPLDVSINKPFKMALKNKYLNYKQKHREKAVKIYLILKMKI